MSESRSKSRGGGSAAEPPPIPTMLTHYHRPGRRPFQRITNLADHEAEWVIGELVHHEPLPFRLTQTAYLPERRLIEQRMRQRFIEKGGDPTLTAPHYFVLGEFSLWETDGSLKVGISLESIRNEMISFTLTDSFFNYRRTSLRGVPIPSRPYHDELFLRSELAFQLRAHRLPTRDWEKDPERRFEVYVEAQVWSDEPIDALLRSG